MARTYIASISQQAEHTIFYRFTCEQCGKDSGWVSNKISVRRSLGGGNIQMDGNGQVSEQSKVEVTKLVLKALKEAMEKYQKEFSRNEYHLRDACPHCKKPQTWSKKGSVKLAFLASFCIAGAAWLLSFVPLAFDVKMPSGIHTIILAGFFFLPWLFMIGSHIIKLTKTKNIANRQKPQINWNGWNFD